VTLRRARKPSVSIEMLNLYTLIRDGAASAAGLSDPHERAKFLREIEVALDQSLADQRRLHGHWAQDLFRAVLISLDGITMIKDEDSGEFYIEQDAPLVLPDFRVVTRAGEHLLIEVKNVGGGFRPRPQRLRAATVRAQQHYAQLTGARLLYAHYWAGNNHWSLVDARVLPLRGDHLVLDQSTAMRANELGLLGDRIIVTDSTMMLSLSSAALGPGRPDAADPVFAELPDGADPILGALELPFELGSVEFMCNGKPLVSPDERRVAAFLFWYGGGIGTIDPEMDEQGTPQRLNITWSSPAGPGSPNIGSFLSSMFTNRYIAQTIRSDGTVNLMRYHPDPELTRLIPPEYSEIPGKVLPLWVGHQFPDPETRASG
jgi:hypothetical protein